MDHAILNETILTLFTFRSVKHTHFEDLSDYDLDTVEIPKNNEYLAFLVFLINPCTSVLEVNSIRHSAKQQVLCD